MSPARLESLRAQMGRRLRDRLELINQQASRFYEAMLELRGRMLILPHSVLQFLERARQVLAAGRVLRIKEVRELLEGERPCPELAAAIECLEKAIIV